jgi:phage repressor protein C with HTH and peptisase S24 domain
MKWYNNTNEPKGYYLFDYQNLSKTLKNNNITSQQLSEELEHRGFELSFETIKSYRKGNVKNPKYNVLAEIADICGVSLIEFFTNGEEQKKKIVKSELSEHIDKYQSLLPSNTLPNYVKAISLINGYVGAGSYGINDNIEVIDKIYVDIHTIEKAYRNKELEAIRVSGDSMKPYIDDGDIALYYKFKDGEKATGDGKYIISTNQGEQIKNIKFMLNGNIRIISENSSYHTKDGYDEEINKESQEYLNIIGKVVGRILKG